MAHFSNDRRHTRYPRITPLVHFSSPASVAKIIQHSHTDLLLAMQHPPEVRRLDANTKVGKKNPRNDRVWQTLHRFGDGIKSCHDMTRLDRWRYAIITSEDEMKSWAKPYTIELTLKKGRCAVWIVDLKRWETGNGWVEVRKLVDAPFASSLRGIITLPPSSHTTPQSILHQTQPDRLPHLLLSDATQGKIYMLDPNDGLGSIWFADPSMESSVETSDKTLYNPCLGITALKYYRGTVYYLNTSMGTIHCVGTRIRNFAPREADPSTLRRFNLKHRSLFGTRQLPPCTDFVVRKTYGPEILLASPTAGIVRVHWHYRWVGRVGGIWYFHTMRRKLPSTSRSNVMAIAIDEDARNPWIIGYTKLWVGTAGKAQRRGKGTGCGKGAGAKVMGVEGSFHGII